ncbi:YceI family protein [Streptomyces antibioticus]|uniref:YceI family protein n=1 Tax=Streptomyces antibioticus TaxID=1890 RepID=UPI003D7110AA
MFNRKSFTLLSMPPRNGLSGLYTIDRTRSTVGFSVHHAMASHAQGEFTEFEGLIKIGGNRSRSEAYLSVQTYSAETGSPSLNAQVSGSEFLDAATFPVMSFRSNGFLDTRAERLRLSGFFRIKDIELPVPVDLAFVGASHDKCGQERVNFEGTVDLLSSDWGLDWATSPISYKMRLRLGISAVRLDPARAA